MTTTIKMCKHAKCECEAVSSCECCDTRFCEEHGSRGREVETAGYASYSAPAVCWKCGGYNADEE